MLRPHMHGDAWLLAFQLAGRYNAMLQWIKSPTIGLADLRGVVPSYVVGDSELSEF